MPLAKVGRPAGRQEYRHQKGGQRKDTMAQFKKVVETLAGGDYEALIEEFLQKKAASLTESEKAKRLMQLLRHWKPLRMMLKGLKTVCERLPTFKYREMVSIVVSTGLSRRAVKDLGWKIGQDGTQTIFNFPTVRIAYTYPT